MDMVPGQEHKSTGNPSARHPEHHSRRGVSRDERSNRLDALPPAVHPNKPTDWATTSGPVCFPLDPSTSRICELETRSGCSGSGCLHPRLDSVSGICKSAMEFGGQGSIPGQKPEGTLGPCGASVEISGMVPNPTGNADSEIPPTAEHTRLNTADPQGQQTRHNPHTSRMGCLRDRFRSKQLSEEATSLLLSSWRQKIAKSYDSLFKKWLGWCEKRGSEPISGDIHEVVNFLAHLFEQGYQYRSLNSYRSAISSVHEKVDGYEVGQHPLVTRLIKGAFHERPPQPRYSETWDVSKVTSFLESLGSNDKLPATELTLKTVMLLALTRPSRSVDLANLSLDYRKYSPEGVTFMPTKLAKQSKQSKPITNFFFPVFPGNKLLCPVSALRAYEDKTKSRRGDHNKSQLFIALIKPYNPISSSTVARWIKTVLTKSGINTDIFKAHSVRSAAVSSAANAGITTNDILKAADWSSESVFQKFYYKPEANSTFGTAVLSKLSTTKK